MATELFKRFLRVLLLEDNENDHVFVREMLRTEGVACEIVLANPRGDFEATLREGKYDLMNSDCTMPSFDGLKALAFAW